ncbi:MAG: acyl carrier protein [Pseudomonadota bacterium]
MTTDELFTEVRAIVASNIDMEVEEVTRSTAMDDIELWDSVAHVDITFALEEKYEIELTQEETEEMNSVQEILSVLERKLKLPA